MAQDMDSRTGNLENRMDRLEGLVEKLAGHMITLAEQQIEFLRDMTELRQTMAKQQIEFQKGMADLKESQQHTDERMGILIKMFDEWIRGNPRNGGRPTSSTGE